MKVCLCTIVETYWKTTILSYISKSIEANEYSGMKFAMFMFQMNFKTCIALDSEIPPIGIWSRNLGKSGIYIEIMEQRCSLQCCFNIENGKQESNNIEFIK